MRKVVSVLSVLLLLVVAIVGASTANASNNPASGGSNAASMSRTPVSAEDGERIARDFLIANASRYGVTAQDLSDLRVTDNYAADASGARYVYFQQTVHGIGLFNGVINVTVLPNGNVLFVGNRTVANIAGKATVTEPTLTQSEAIAAAADALGLSYTASTVTEASSVAGSERAVTFSGGDLSLESIPVKLAYQPTESGDLVLSWDLNIYQQDAQHWWAVRVDATTGAVVDKNDWVVSENFDDAIEGARANGTLNSAGATSVVENRGVVTGAAPAAGGDGSSYKVYPVPVESPNHTAPLPPADGRVVVNEPSQVDASPYGWHDNNGAAGAEFTTTQGNNAHAYTDVDANNVPDAGSSPDGGAGLDFAPTIDLTQGPSAYRPAAVVNLFYWNNLMHDIPYVHGFNEAAGNFQENNYGEGGAGSDYVFAEAQDGSGTNNANFGTPADGTNPRMQMYIWTLTSPQRDGDLDSGIIAHEYGHGISNRLTGGPANVSCLNNAEQAGEGWSDWQSITLTARASDTRTTNRGVGTYALGQPITGVGIRAFPYNTDMSIDPRTYQNTRTAAVPHGVGSIWTAIVWEVYWNLVDDHGFNPNIYGDWTTGGNNLAYKLVQDGMAIQPCRPGFVDARDAIIAADEALTGGANFCSLWEGFAKRGLGTDAVQGSNTSNSDNTNGFLLPPECGGATPTPTATPTTSADPDINVAPTSVAETHNGPQTTNEVLAIGNTGGATLNWTITEAAAVPSESRVVVPIAPNTQHSTGHAPIAANSRSSGNTPIASLGGTMANAYRFTFAGTDIVEFADILTPGTQTSVGATARSLFSGDYIGTDYSTLYVIDSDTNQFLAIDTSDASETVLGTSTPAGGESWSGLSYDATTSTLYGSATSCASSTLYTINQTNGTATAVGSVSNAGCLIDIAVSPSGQMYGVDIINDTTLAINKSTGAGTVVGATGIDANFAQGMDFDDASGVLYYASFNNGSFNGELRTVDLTSGASTLVGAFGADTTEIDSFAIQGGGAGPACTASDIPWLTVSPTNGATAPGGSSNVTLTFDSTALATGTYTGTLCIESNDPDENPVEVPVSLTVNAPTAVELGSLTNSTAGFPVVEAFAAGLLLAAGAVVLYRRSR